MLHPGDMHSTDGWRGLLEPIAGRYEWKGGLMIFTRKKRREGRPLTLKWEIPPSNSYRNRHSWKVIKTNG